MGLDSSSFAGDTPAPPTRDGLPPDYEPSEEVKALIDPTFTMEEFHDALRKVVRKAQKE